METVEGSVARNVRRLREDRRHTVRSLSAKLGELGRPILPSGITKIEDGSRRVDVGDLVALGEVLGVSPATLLMPPNPTADEERLWRARWRWMHGEQPLPGSDADPAEFRRENRPYENPDPIAEVARVAGTLLRGPFHLEIDADADGVESWQLGGRKAKRDKAGDDAG